MPQLAVEGILFDLDGTLIDSSASVERNWRKLADKIGMPWDEISPWIDGIPVRQVMRRLVPDMSDERVEEMHEFMVEAESTDTADVVAMPGALAALAILPPSRWAVVTSGGVRLATSRLAAAGLPRPVNMVTADDVRVGKPDPEPFRKGAAVLGFPPERCLAFEDAPPGITSAQHAGVAVIGIRSTHPDLADPAVADLAAVTFSVDDSGITVSW